MIKKGIISLSVLMILQSVAFGDTVTTTTFKAPTTSEQDEYGNSYIDREATISTQNFKVDNFWGGFKQDSKKSNNYTTISRSGLFRITTSSTSACTLESGLEAEGCSGQKPFLINDEVLNNPIPGTTNKYKIVFTDATKYTNNDYNGFYPLDISRKEAYYKEPATDSNTTGTTAKKSFFGYITGAIDYVFNKVVGVSFFGQKDIADVKGGARSDAAQDRRQRYIANIIAGIDQDDRLTKNTEDASATVINAPTLNTPPSLLHYAEAKRVTTDEECKFAALQLSSDGLMCRVMTGFGMNAWMPFFSHTNTTKIQSNFILADTENALLAMLGQMEKVPYMTDVAGNETQQLSFLQNIIKPMTAMFDLMKAMFFGSDKQDIVADPAERVLSFNEDDAMTMTVPVTNDGTQIDDFVHFKLLKMHSVYADNINSCRVVKVPGMISWSSWDHTFVEGGNISEKSPNSRVWKKEVWNSDQWVKWCQEATNKKGMFDYLADWSTGGPFNPFNWMKGMFTAFLTMFTGEFDIKEISNSIQRGLVLEVEKVDLDPVSKRNTRKIKILNINTPGAGK